MERVEKIFTNRLKNSRHLYSRIVCSSQGLEHWEEPEKLPRDTKKSLSDRLETS